MLAFTADNHIGVTSQWSIKERKDDFMTSFHNVIDEICRSKDPENALIIGGDLFDTAYPPSFAVEFVQSEIRRLRSCCSCAVLGIDGNHDIANGKWLRVCDITPLSDEPCFLPGKYTNLRICGLHYQRSTSILEKLNQMADRGVLCNVLVLHLAFGDLNRMGAASDLSSKELLPVLKALGVKLVLMGHIHIRQSVDIDGVRFAYCGSTELCSMNEPKEKSFELIDPTTLDLSPVSIKTRVIVHTVIGNEKEFAAFAASVKKNSGELQSMYIVPDVKDGVKRLRAIADDNNLMMRVQIIHPTNPGGDENTSVIDRATGIIGLEQAIGKDYASDSDEATLIRAILRAPETMKVIIDEYMKGETVK